MNSIKKFAFTFFKSDFKIGVVSLDRIKKNLLSENPESMFKPTIVIKKNYDNENKNDNMMKKKSDFFLEREKKLSSKILKSISTKEIMQIFLKEQDKK